MSQLSNISTTFALLTHNPIDFISKNQKKSDDFKLLTKTVFDFVRGPDGIVHSKDLRELLITSDFDDEQVWQQLELDNRLNIDSSVKIVAGLLAEGDFEFFKVLTSSNQLPSDHEGAEKEEESESETENHQAEQSLELFGKTFVNEEEDEKDSEDYDDDEVSTSEEDREQLSNDEELLDSDGTGEKEVDDIKRKHTGMSSVLDDDFFKLSEMNDFLLTEEKKSENQATLSLDLFSPGEDDEEDVANYRFEDFFDPPNKSFSEPESKNYELSTFEKRQEKMKKKIQELEDEALNPKPWQLAGEVSATRRPENSLLEEFLQFDHVTRQPPAITEEVTQKLEDLILQRIKDKAWDDVERKVKPKNVDPYEYKKKHILDEMKSKQTLSQIYEEEYLKKITPPEQTEEKEEHRKIRTAMKELFVKLDALSNFHFVPKPVAPDIKIINNLPTVIVEEVQPSSVSTSQLLAPEEILRKSREELKGSTETTSTDKKRARRKKKMHQRIKALKQKTDIIGTDKKVEKKKSGSGSSSAFFTKLHDTVKVEKAMEKEGKDLRKKRKWENVLSAKKFKL